MSGYRLPGGGALINRDKPVTFRFDGRAETGLAGDTLASALLASGRVLFGRSFKYHRPRGVFSAGSEEPNALVELRAGARKEPNTRATTAELFVGLNAESQNRAPSLSFDLMAVNDLLSPVLAAGFYYKTFMAGGTRGWLFFERFIRRAAGLGRATLEADPDRYERSNAFADVIVVGGGPAGLAAARAAADTGVRVILVDEGPVLGGRSFEDDGTVDGLAPADWARSVATDLAARPNVRILTRTTVYGYFDGNTLGAVERVADHKRVPGPFEPRQRHWTLYAGQVVLATGALERPLVFPGNDRPGVLLASAGLAYARRWGVAVGRGVAVFADNDSGARTALALKHMGVAVTTVIDPRRTIGDGLATELAQAGITLKAGSVVTGTAGRLALKSISVTGFDEAAGILRGATERIACDALLVSGGFVPTVHLASQAGGPPVYDDTLKAFLPGAPREAWTACGAVAGKFDLATAVASGAEAGHGAGLAAGGTGAVPAPATVAGAAPAALSLPLGEVPAKGKAFVDLQNDVSADDVRLAEREGFRSVEHLKRYTTLGMAADQGKTSNVNGIAVMAAARGVSIPEVGTTRFRPPFTPVAMGAIAGREHGAHLQPHRLTPMHGWHLARGAEMMAAGLWQRPRIYPKKGESLEQAYVREARAVRAGVGLVDVSTLGKIEVQGPDAAVFLDRIYSNPMARLPIGKARYGTMLREDGILFDDGTAWRLSETRFLVTTTTANAAAVLSHLEHYLDVVWPELKVHVTSVTDQWAGMAIAGPKSRAVLSRAVADIDFATEAFPMMGVRHGTVAGRPVMVARLSFSGELAYEVFTGWRDGLAVWEALMATGAADGIVPYGLEALGTLRIEKGHITGAEMDGRTTLADLGLGGMASRKKAYVGSAMIDRPGLVEDRHVMVGFISKDGRPVRAGSHLRDLNAGPSIGHVTATAFSPALEAYIGLALVKGGRDLMGQSLEAVFPLKNESIVVEVVSPTFVDPDGSRMHV